MLPEEIAAKAGNHHFVLEEEIADGDAHGVLASQEFCANLLADSAEPDDGQIEGARYRR